MTRRPTFDDLVATMARLRGPGGCPWDREQTHRSLRPYLLEETYEALDAIDSGSPQQLCQELGDLLLQVVFHAQMAKDAGAFTIDDVVAGLVDKLVRRHPHVFGDVTVEGSGEVLANWASIKAQERSEGRH
jgi:tetrapyrrole methylase family protein / MazG family protein